MKLYTLKFLIIVMVAMLIAGTAVDVNAKKRTAKTSARPITALADNIRAIESTKVDSYNDCKEYKSNIEAQALPCFKKAYNPKATTTEQKVKAVLAQLGKYAEKKLESGSNFEMADAGFIHKVIHDYNAITAHEQMLGKAPSPNARKALEAEIDAWITLRNALQEYCDNGSYLEFFGGSMALLGVSGSRWSLAEMRDNDTKALNKSGLNAKATQADMSAVSATASTMIVDLSNNAKALIESINGDKSYHQELFDDVSNGINDATKQLATALPRWLEARKSLLRFSKNPKADIKATKDFLDAIKTLAISSEE